ncbi:hypothetical protein R5R35_011635 [Gryllus longicercus]|uniref:CCC domain-containing protein n=1 Tax=Gryllus longicercus TaxID=2509291 RepID=A0AAN9VJI6_9ORTH
MAPRVQRAANAPLAVLALLLLLLLQALALVAGGPPTPEERAPSRCPLCDSSVFGYCSEKLLHDYCCCHSRYDPEPLPYQCRYADCSFLHANSCKEHKLIAECCCNRIFFQYLKSLA